MTTGLGALPDLGESFHELVYIDWSRLGHVIVCANGKGGIGKTTTAQEIGAAASADGVDEQGNVVEGARVLLVDVNIQGNQSESVGIAADPSRNDDGQNLLRAVTMGEKLVPVRNVRPNMDLVVGGTALRQLTSWVILARTSQDPNQVANSVLALAKALMDIADEYDLIIIDGPPENEALLSLCLAAARWLLIPVDQDTAARKGLRFLIPDIRRARQLNPYLTILGCFTFGIKHTETKIIRGIREQIIADLNGTTAKMFDTNIRYSSAYKSDARKLGKVAFELEELARSKPSYWDVKSGKAEAGVDISISEDTARKLADDWAQLGTEVFDQIEVLKALMIEQGVWPQ